MNAAVLVVRELFFYAEIQILGHAVLVWPSLVQALIDEIPTRPIQPGLIYICVHKPINDGRISSNFINRLNLDDIASRIIKFFTVKTPDFILKMCKQLF